MENELAHPLVHASLQVVALYPASTFFHNHNAVLSSPVIFQFHCIVFPSIQVATTDIEFSEHLLNPQPRYVHIL
jgi:hypothetical protein